MAKTAVFKPLTNRDTTAAASDKSFALPADGFVQLVPKGEAPNVIEDGSKTGKRIIQVVDDVALGLMFNMLLNRDGEEMLIDDDHLSHEMDQSTDANGWQLLNKETLQIREDGLYGDPRWTTLGLGKLNGGVKRYISPEFSPSSLVPLGGLRHRVTELTGLALTNRPGFKRLQKPLTNRDADADIDNTNTTTNHMHKELLAAHLGITTSALDALDETALKNRLQTIKTSADKSDAATTELTALKNREADEFITKHEKVIPKKDSLRKHLRETFLANRELAEELVSGYAGEGDGKELTAEQKARAATKPLFNREQAKAPDGDATAKEEKAAAWIGARARELTLNNRSMRHQEAFAQAESEYAAKAD